MKQKKYNTPEFNKLLKLEKEHKITIGLHRSQVNNFWFRTTILGKIANILTYLFFLLIIIIFVKFGIWFGILATVLLVVYVKALQKIAGLYVRLRLFQEEELFNAAYEAKSVTIRDNKNGNIICFPDEWNMLNDDKVLVLGVSISQESFPILYKWAQEHPETLRDQVKSIAKAWHEGDALSAMQALESDLQHG